MSNITIPELARTPASGDPGNDEASTVEALLQKAAYFPIFNVANPAFPNHPNFLIPGIPFLIKSVDVNEQLHRFQAVSAYVGHELRAAKCVGEPVAKVGIQWTPLPDYFAPSPGGKTPAWMLNPLISQRFTMLGGHLDFQDEERSGVRAFGVGRTYPVVEGGKSRLRIAAAIEVLEGLGKFKGLNGAFTIIGYIEPPDNLALNLMVRMMDPGDKLRAEPGSAMAPMQPMPDPDPDAVFVMLKGETDPARESEPILSADGKRTIGFTVRERLRLVTLEFDLATAAGLRSSTKEGPFVGALQANMYFDASDPAKVTPILTTQGIFTFTTPDGGMLGTVSANIVEGRAIRTTVEGYAKPLFRMVGFGPILRGTGQFEGADGMMVMNGATSVTPPGASKVYVFRFFDPQGKINAAWGETTSGV